MPGVVTLVDVVVIFSEMADQRLGDRISRSIILSRLRVGETWLPMKTEPMAGMAAFSSLP